MVSSSRQGHTALAALVSLFTGAAVAVSLGFYVAAQGEPGAAANKSEPAPSGKQLYLQSCAACHGEQGDGNGPAARFLYPRPRNFGEGKFRLASTANYISTDDDLLRVITRGMPGSAMFPFAHLSENDRRSLVQYVRELTSTAFIEAARREAEKAGEKVDINELKKEVAEVLKPGEAVAIPAEWPKADDASVARGRALYLKTCAACHGTTGKGDGGQDQKNLDGTPTSPRDFTRGIFKGGREREQLFARISLGMAGTPMPATTDAPPTDICDLVHFIQSLSSPDVQTKVEHRRTTVTVRRLSEPFGETISESQWATATPVRIVVSPLWWRNYSEPELAVRALYDGKSLAMRLTWRDETANDRIIKPDDFEDMAAVQLFQGAAEPFLGMGAVGAPVDLWLWRATWQKPRDLSASPADDYPFDSPFYRERLKALGKPTTDLQTARAAGNPHAHGSDQTATNLAAKGFGSTTFMPKPSQLVAAKSNWTNGTWTVELRRPLAVHAGEGTPLVPGSRYSIAFALWDGAAHDRNGQKLVSIWHDLLLEK